jgi:hypothetical protein
VRPIAVTIRFDNLFRDPAVPELTKQIVVWEEILWEVTAQVPPAENTEEDIVSPLLIQRA